MSSFLSDIRHLTEKFDILQEAFQHDANVGDLAPLTKGANHLTAKAAFASKVAGMHDKDFPEESNHEHHSKAVHAWDAAHESHRGVHLEHQKRLGKGSAKQQAAVQAGFDHHRQQMDQARARHEMHRKIVHGILGHELHGKIPEVF